MHRWDFARLEPGHACWVPAVVSPQRDWPAASGCRRGSRFLVDAATLRPSRDDVETFRTQLDCLEWIMSHRVELARSLPGGTVRAVRLDRWLLGLD